MSKQPPKVDRNSVLRALWKNPAPKEGMTTAELCEQLCLDRTIIQRPLTLLRLEGFVETVVPNVTSDDRKHVHRLTAKGKQRALRLWPPSPQYTAWGAANGTRQAVVRVLLESVGDHLMMEEIQVRSQKRFEVVEGIVTDAHAAGLVSRIVVRTKPRTYGYTLTSKGRQQARVYLNEAAIPLDTVYRVRLSSPDNPEALALLEGLRQLPGVFVDS